METPTNIVVKGMLFKERLFIITILFCLRCFYSFLPMSEINWWQKTLCFSVLFQCMLSLKQMIQSQMMFFGLMISSHKWISTTNLCTHISEK